MRIVGDADLDGRPGAFSHVSKALFGRAAFFPGGAIQRKEAQQTFEANGVKKWPRG
jgi:hypothetical protein